MTPIFFKLLTLPLITGVFYSAFTLASVPQKKITYQTYFGDCPTRTAGSLALKIVRDLENNLSLKDVKEKLIKEGLFQKYFLSNYNISYDPFSKLLKFSFNCPRPIMKVQVTSEGAANSYNAILAENGMLFDPTYEVLLREENKLIDELPLLAFPLKEIDSSLPHQISRLFASCEKELQSMFSEIILGPDNGLTVILSVSSRPMTAFLGKSDWDKKLARLSKIINFLGPKNKIPSVVNLSNEKKVVVKFSDKF